MKKLIIIILLFILILTTAYSMEQSEIPIEIRRHNLMGVGLAFNLLSMQSINYELLDIGIAIMSASIPPLNKWGYTGFTSLSATLLIIDNYKTTPLDLNMISFDNILGFGKNFKMNNNLNWLSVGAGIHIGNASYYSNEINFPILSIGPAILIALKDNMGMGLITEIHYDTVTPTARGNIENIFTSRFGYSFMLAHRY